MATIKEAVVLARDFLLEMIPDADSVRLEEATLDHDDDTKWNIVLSYEEPAQNPFAARGGRIWKVIDVGRQGSELLGLRVWEM